MSFFSKFVRTARDLFGLGRPAPLQTRALDLTGYAPRSAVSGPMRKYTRVELYGRHKGQ